MPRAKNIAGPFIRDDADDVAYKDASNAFLPGVRGPTLATSSTGEHCGTP